MDIVQVSPNYRMTKDDQGRFTKSREYYRLYAKFIDDFGNENYKQVWSGGVGMGGASDYSGMMADWLFNLLSKKDME